MTVEHPRRIRSFVRRPGRITTGQRNALERLLPKYGIADSGGEIDLNAAFGRDSRRILDIGFGDGEALVSAAAMWPDVDFLGIEVHAPGVGHLLAAIERARLTNVRVIDRDAVDVVDQLLGQDSFDAVKLLFPDPWPKKRHHKRRIIQPPFVAALARILKPAGLLHVATDWANYAEQAEQVIDDAPQFSRIEPESTTTDPLVFRAPTKFEARGRRLGHEVVDLYYRLGSPPS